MFKKLAADALGLSDVGVIIAPGDDNKVDADDYPFHEDGKKISRGLNFTLVTTLGDLDLLGEVTGGGGFASSHVRASRGFFVPRPGRQSQVLLRGGRALHRSPMIGLVWSPARPPLWRGRALPLDGVSPPAPAGTGGPLPHQSPGLRSSSVSRAAGAGYQAGRPAAG